MKNILIILISLLSLTALAQPANDFCSGAATSPQNGSCLGGTTVGAADNWVGSLGCAGNNPEVWYSFVATGTQATFTVTSGTLGGNVEIVLVLSSAPPCGGLSLAGSVCGPSPNTATFATTPSSTYYYTISGTGSSGTFTSCVLSSNPPPAAGFNCSNAATLCAATSFSQSTSNTGFGTQEVNTANSCWGSGGERQSKWFKFSIGCSGTLAFNINPNASGDDYDFAVWNITSAPGTCAGMGNSIACNWSGCKGSTGLSSCPTSEAGVNTGGAGCFGGPAAWSAPINVVAGNVYALLVDNFSTSNSGFNLSWGGACGMTAIIGPNAAFTGVITNSCMTLTTTKTCTISPTTNSTYLWNFGDGFTSTAYGPVAHTYTATGNYNVSLTVTDLLGCSVTTSQAFNMGCVVLPVELISFTGTKNLNGTNTLEWSTASEKNNARFILEKSKDAIDFEKLISVSGAGNSNQIHNYSAIDNSPYPNVSYYRLKLIATDETISYSQLVSINYSPDKNEDFIIVPNPAQDGEVILKYNCNADTQEFINIYDNTGALVMTEKINCYQGQNNTKLNIDKLPAGLYLVYLNANGKLYKTKLVRTLN